jgi:redox-sensitive bicupin YhaK (pirin superfamily)
MGDRFGQSKLIVLRRGDVVALTAVGAAQIVLFGGEPMDGPRHTWWNFVPSRKERIEHAKEQWRAAKFDPVPGDSEFIPLPEPKPPETQVPGTVL